MKKKKAVYMVRKTKSSIEHLTFTECSQELSVSDCSLVP